MPSEFSGSPREYLELNGYNYDGYVVDKRGKKHTIFSKKINGLEFEFKGCSIFNDKKIIMLIEY